MVPGVARLAIGNLLYFLPMTPEISYLTILAVSVATACFMIAVMHFVMWVRTGLERQYLFSTTMVAAAGCVAIFDLLQIRSTDIASYVMISRFMHVGLLVMLISLLCFIRTYLDEGPRWLIVVIAAMWGLVMVPNFLSPAGVVYAQITDLTSATTSWGEFYTVARGPINPWKYVADAATPLILLFVGKASWAAWHKGRRRSALTIGGSIAFFILVAGSWAQLQDAGIVNVPLFIPLTFFTVIVALTYEIVNDAFRANAAALEVRQLRRAISMGEIAGGLAHEINQPLAAILSNAQAARRLLQLDDVELNEVREIIDDIIDDEKRAAKIILGLRQMLQRDAPGNNLAAIDNAIEATMDLINGELNASGVTLNIKMDSKLNAVRVDRNQLVEVLLNLVHNSIRAAKTMPPEFRQVTIGARNKGRDLLVSVSDHGPGISDHLVASVFEPFVSRSGDGLGMGLPLCKRIIERHGGKIWFEHRQGGGAVFKFTLPFAEAGAAS